jgi:hypothetical protein
LQARGGPDARPFHKIQPNGQDFTPHESYTIGLFQRHPVKQFFTLKLSALVTQ